MAYFHVEDFRRGLDTRKATFTAPPGSLRTCKNAHVTRGGEVEKRMALEVFAELPAGTHGLHVLRDEVYTFGSDPEPAGMPSSVRYVRLEHPDGAHDMTRILSTANFDGYIYAVAEFADGSVEHYYRGQHVTTADTGLSGIDAAIRALAVGVVERTTFLVATSDDEMTITSDQVGVPFSLASEMDSADIDITEVETPVEPVDPVPATGSFQFVLNIPYPLPDPPPSVLQVHVGPEGASHAQLLADPVQLQSGDSQYSFASRLTTAINANSDASGIEAEVDADSVITLTSIGPDHEQWNTLEIGLETTEQSYVNSDDGSLILAVDAVQAMADGVNGADGQGVQIYRVQLTGAFDADTQYNIQIDGEDIRIKGDSLGTGRVVMAFQNRMWSLAQSILYFTGFEETSGDPDPTRWDADATGTVGAGFINMGTQDGGAETLTGLGVYQSSLAVFSRRAVQIWQVDPDPENMSQTQLIRNIGTMAPDSVQSFGDIDLFFLSESGVRSLRARDSSNSASAQDVGTAIDGDILREFADLPGGVRRRTRAVLEPRTGRYWMAIGPTAYVFSHFPGSKISAWSAYDVGDTVEAAASSAERVYLRSGDEILLYGGLTGSAYDEAEVEVWLPFMDADTPGTRKTVTSISVGCEGEWDVYLHPDPAAPEYSEFVTTVGGTTFGLHPTYPARAVSTHFSFRLVNRSPGYARLTSFLVHYESGEAS